MKDVKEITEQLEQGVKDVFQSEAYIQYLDFVGKFYNYSANNCLLIWMQNPEATLVAGYKTWQTKFKRHVKKGEKGITILAPCPHKAKKETKNEEGEVEVKEIKWTTFKPAYVWDISQTDGDEVPAYINELTGEVEGGDGIIERLTAISPVPVGYEDIKGGANGYFHTVDKRIAVKQGMAQAQTIKTLVHEVAHAILHDRETGEQKEADRRTKEVQAESVAYVVCTAMGLDTSDYSFGYVAGWSGDKEVKALTESMEVIRKTAQHMIEAMRAA